METTEVKINSLFAIVERFYNREREIIGGIGKTPLSKKLLWLFILLAIVPFICSVVIGLVAWIYSIEDKLKTPALLALLVCYIGIFLYALIAIFCHRKSIYKHLSNPYYTFESNAKICAEADLSMFGSLKNLPISQLKFLLLEINAEIKAFKGRFASIAGSLHTVGLFPGLLALVVTLQKIDSSISVWILSVAYLMPVFYFMGFVVNIVTVRLERISSVIEFAIELREPEGKGWDEWFDSHVATTDDFMDSRALSNYQPNRSITLED